MSLMFQLCWGGKKLDKMCCNAFNAQKIQRLWWWSSSSVSCVLLTIHISPHQAVRALHDQWSTPRISMVTSACYSKRICCFSRDWGWWSKKSTLKELNFGALDVSEYAIMPQRVGTPAEVLATSLFFFSKCFDFILVTFRLYSRSFDSRNITTLIS